MGMKEERATGGAVQRLMEDEEGVSDMLDYSTIGVPIIQFILGGGAL